MLRKAKWGEFTGPRQIDRSIDPALEAVCVKAMTFAPEHRYATCRALADDIERWTAGQPVTAWEEPLSRRVRRWGGRTVTAATVALLAGLVGLAVAQARANGKLATASVAAGLALGEAIEAKHETDLALAQSEESRERAEAVRKFLTDAFRRPDPTQDGRQIKAVDLLDQAAGKLAKEVAGSSATRERFSRPSVRCTWASASTRSCPTSRPTFSPGPESTDVDSLEKK